MVIHGSKSFFLIPGWFSWFQVHFHDYSWFWVVFIWFQVGFSWFQVGFMVIHGSMLDFHGSMWLLWFFMVLCRFFMVSVGFFMIPGGFWWFSMIPGRFFMAPVWFFMVLYDFRSGFWGCRLVFMINHDSRSVSWFQVGFYVFSWFKVGSYPSWAPEARSETLRTPNKVPTWSAFWPQDSARPCRP